MVKVVKRDGEKVNLDQNRITVAIQKAIDEVYEGNDSREGVARSISEEIVLRITEKEISVESIQDKVEEMLMDYNEKDVAKAYILYRAERNKIRERNSQIMNVLRDLTYQSAEDSDVKRENANIDGNTAMGTMLKYGAESSKLFYKNDMLDPKYSKAHDNGEIHIHDLDFLSLTTTCCQIDLGKLFEGGFSTGHGHLREPNSIGSYGALSAIAIQSNQNDQHGGQSIPCYDYYLAKGVAKSYITEVCKVLETRETVNEEVISLIKEQLKEYIVTKSTYIIEGEGNDYIKYVLKSHGIDREEINKVVSKALKNTDRLTYQAMEGIIHNLNTMHSRAGAQVPFSSINYGTDTSPEGRMVTKNLLLSIEAGLGNGETAIFPISIFKVKEGINYNEGDPNYDLFKLACRVSAKRLFPNFSFIDAPFNLQYYDKNNPDTEISYMGKVLLIKNLVNCCA